VGVELPRFGSSVWESTGCIIALMASRPRTKVLTETTVHPSNGGQPKWRCGLSRFAHSVLRGIGAGTWRNRDVPVCVMLVEEYTAITEIHADPSRTDCPLPLPTNGHRLDRLIDQSAPEHVWESYNVAAKLISKETSFVGLRGSLKRSHGVPLHSSFFLSDSCDTKITSRSTHR
jgi:hypothetical protein